MTITVLTPTCIRPSQLVDALKSQGYGVLGQADVATLVELPALESIKADWDALPPDLFLKDGGHYRRRRHSSFVVDGEQVKQVTHRAHYQPLAYNALHGGMHRLFEPMTAETVAKPVWTEILQYLCRICSKVKGEQPWYVEAHQFRIDTSNGIGRPTPEGAHRDGVDFVAILLVAREQVSGGESRIFDADGPNGQRFTLIEPWTLLMLDDQRVIHESTPIQPTADGGHRDTLVLTFRSGGFLEELPKTNN